MSNGLPKVNFTWNTLFNKEAEKLYRPFKLSNSHHTRLCKGCKNSNLDASIFPCSGCKCNGRNIENYKKNGLESPNYYESDPTKGV